MSIKDLRLKCLVPGDDNFFEIIPRDDDNTIVHLKCRIKEERDDLFGGMKSSDIIIYKSYSTQSAKEMIETCKVRRDDEYGVKLSDTESISNHFPNTMIEHKTEIHEDKSDIIAKLDDDTASYKANSDDISNSDIYQETNIQYPEPPIRTESKSPHSHSLNSRPERMKIYKLSQKGNNCLPDHEQTKCNELSGEIEFLERMMQSIEYPNSPISYDKDKSSYIASEISDQQKTIPNTPLPVEYLDDSDEIELTKNQNIELDLIRDLRNA
ncbi:8471_t:CDS:2 [Acaulospora morrowiae]|uniref:8471_t:CDS:1 n=1 Tax=Acaulospora morrowiae TaxID=94023 RepID=A0A9N9H5Y7_9GLOM|nr:8471_t:CDS:2 [Acaulospora morrowiae]